MSGIPINLRTGEPNWDLWVGFDPISEERKEQLRKDREAHNKSNKDFLTEILAKKNNKKKEEETVKPKK